MKKEDFLKIVRSKATKELTEQEVSFFGSIGEAVEKAFEQDSVIRKKELEDLTAMIGVTEEGKSVAEIIRGIAGRIDDMEKKSKRGLSDSDKYLLKSKLEEKKDEILRCARDSQNKKEGWAIEFKAARAASALMTTATVLTGAQAINNTNVFDDMDIAVIKYPANFIIDAIGGRTVGRVPAVWQWKEQITESDGVPAVVSEGAAKPLTDKLFVWKYANRKKYAGRIEFTMETEIDFDQLMMQIIDMFEEQVIRTWNEGVQADIIAWAPAYTSTGLDGFFIAPGIAQVIEAGKLQISDNNYMADMVMLNPVDAAKAMIHQNVDGDIVYLPEAIAFRGLTPFITNKLTAGTILVGTSNIIKEQHSNFIVRRGVYGDQFIENEETIVGEVFSNLKLPTISQNSWVELDVDTVTAALTKV